MRFRRRIANDLGELINLANGAKTEKGKIRPGSRVVNLSLGQLLDWRRLPTSPRSHRSESYLHIGHSRASRGNAMPFVQKRIVPLAMLSAAFVRAQVQTAKKTKTPRLRNQRMPISRHGA